MWTPKRILILISGLAVFLSGYGVYAYFLGGIDGLPPLPEEFCHPGELPPPPVDLPANAIDSKLKQAFGPECPELKRMIKLDLRRKGWALAANHFESEKDGRIKLTPFSALIISKRKGEDGFPDIHTVRCEEAYLTLDRPITNMAELGNRKITRVELFGNARGAEPKPIYLKNNRATARQDDDVEVLITENPKAAIPSPSCLVYDEKNHEIQSDGIVKLQDRQAGVKPTEINGTGMKIFLTKEETPPQHSKSKRKNKNDGASGVDHLVLEHHVTMHLWVDAQSGLFGSGSEKGKKKLASAQEPAAKPEKAHLIISTDGPFLFNPGKDIAVFDSPPDGAGRYVEVMRENKSAGRNDDFDRLECNCLELKFRPKEGGPGKDDPAGNKDIETAHATARKGGTVKLDMVADQLHAEGDEMLYHGPTATAGATTIITGQPLQASKEGHRLFALRLTLVNPDKNGEGQKAFAQGPGHIDLFDKSKADQPDKHYPWHAVWKDTLTSVKDKQGDKLYDLLTLTGDAKFVDEARNEELQGDRLQVWLEPSGSGDEKKDPADTKEVIPGAGRQRPHKVDAFGNVVVHSPQFNVPAAQHLVLNFEDGVVKNVALPAALPETKSPAASGVKTALPNVQSPARLGPPERPALGKQAADKSGMPSGNNKEPMDLEAREITAYVVRLGSENFLRELKADGSVHVHQNGATPKDKGVDIKGDLLKLFHFVPGDVLHVWGGDPSKLAELHLGELTLIGPKVMINQKDNFAEIDGIGAMHMPAKNTLDGTKPAKEGSRLIITWNKDMVFDGRYAAFHGGIIAYQDDASLRCQDLEVMLDRPVSFKDGQKGGQEAKLEKMLCYLKVQVLEQKLDERGKLISYHRLDARSADMDNPAERTHASGPGRTWIFSQRGSEDNAGARPRKQQTSGADAEWELTRIDFTGAMVSKGSDKARLTTFLEDVHVYHCPADRPDLEFDRNRPPKGGFYLTADKVMNYTRTLDKDKKTQEMQAEGKVLFRSRELFGYATTLKYNQAQELAVFEGPAENPVRLYRLRQQGAPAQEIRGTRILYNRRTGDINVDGSTHIGD